MTEIKNIKINAISSEFPLLTNYANKRPEKRATSPCCVKQFNDQRFGNNREAPTYLQLPRLRDNTYTYLNTYIEKSREIEKNIKEKSNNLRTEELTVESLKKLNSYVEKQGINISKSLDRRTFQDKFYMEKLNISPKYLKNLNDFNIAESYQIDEDRQFKFDKKISKKFNCLTDKIMEINPGKYSTDKWSKFYENYLTISENNPGFKFQKGYFTDFIDHQQLTLGLQKFMFMDKLHKEKKEVVPVTQKKTNRRYICLTKEKSDKNKKKTLEVLEKNNLFKIKSYLIKNGVLN